jgi:hypothetical protein
VSPLHVLEKREATKTLENLPDHWLNIKQVHVRGFSPDHTPSFLRLLPLRCLYGYKQGIEGCGVMRFKRNKQMEIKLEMGMNNGFFLSMIFLQLTLN